MLDYRVNYKQEYDSEYTVYQDGILPTELTVTGLTPGVFYDFKVEARNLIGFS